MFLSDVEQRFSAWLGIFVFCLMPRGKKPKERTLSQGCFVATTSSLCL